MLLYGIWPVRYAINKLIRGINNVNTSNQGSIKCSIMLLIKFLNYRKGAYNTQISINLAFFV